MLYILQLNHSLNNSLPCDFFKIPENPLLNTIPGIGQQKTHCPIIPKKQDDLKSKAEYRLNCLLKSSYLIKVRVQSRKSALLKIPLTIMGILIHITENRKRFKKIENGITKFNGYHSYL